MCIVLGSAAGLWIGIASAVSSTALGIYGAVAQAQQANAQMAFQAKQMQLQMMQTREQMMLSQNQAASTLNLQREQGNQQLNFQIESANAAMVQQYNTARDAVMAQRAQLTAGYEGQKYLYNTAFDRANDQVKLNSEAANRVYMAEQLKVTEAQKEATFAQQGLLAKAIGAAGTILASGRVGQSVGLLVNDTERQAGFATAQHLAMLESKRQQSIIQMESAAIQNESANNAAYSNLPLNPSAPVMPPMPTMPTLVGLGISSNAQLAGTHV